jgi:lysophospholipid acyltransferase (LPLAT)-like uncharacterized protein
MSGKTEPEEIRRQLRAEFYALPADAMVDRRTVAAVRYVAVQTVELEAIRGGGVPYRRVGRRALYRKADVLAWMESGELVHVTADLPPSPAPKKARGALQLSSGGEA